MIFFFLFTHTCRRQFDLANREAMDESAEWRLKYDEEVERATKCLTELIKVCTTLINFIIFLCWFILLVWDVVHY